MRCSAVRCGAVRCRAVPCCEVLCGAVRCDAGKCGVVRCGAVGCSEVLAWQDNKTTKHPPWHLRPRGGPPRQQRWGPLGLVVGASAHNQHEPHRGTAVCDGRHKGRAWRRWRQECGGNELAERRSCVQPAQADTPALSATNPRPLSPPSSPSMPSSRRDQI